MSRKHSNKYLIIDKVAMILMEQFIAHQDNPREDLGLSTHSIFDKLIDLGMSRWLPTRSSMGSILHSIPGVIKADTATGYTVGYSRPIVVWTIDTELYDEWRAKH